MDMILLGLAAIALFLVYSAVQAWNKTTDTASAATKAVADAPKAIADAITGLPKTVGIATRVGITELGMDARAMADEGAMTIIYGTQKAKSMAYDGMNALYTSGGNAVTGVKKVAADANTMVETDPFTKAFLTGSAPWALATFKAVSVSAPIPERTSAGARGTIGSVPAYKLW
jgi:hypothetical protein